MRRGEFSVETVFTSFKLDFRARVPGRAFPFILLFARSNQSLFDGELLFGVVAQCGKTSKTSLVFEKKNFV